MKCNPDKINEFLSNDNIDLITREFVINLFKKFCEKEDNEINPSKILLLDLGFYEVDKSELEDLDEYELEVIDFYKISTFHIELKKMLFEYFLKTMDDNPTDFGESFFINDLKMIVHYSDWKRINRKNKLDNLNNL